MVDIILDIDSVGDDILAVIYGALHKEMNLLGITTVNGACGSIEQAVNVALATVELTGKEIPVYQGADKMLALRKSEAEGDPVNFDEELRWKFGNRLDKFNEKCPEFLYGKAGGNCTRNNRTADKYSACPAKRTGNSQKSERGIYPWGNILDAREYHAGNRI